MQPHAITELSLAVAAVVASARLVSLNLAGRFPALLAYLAFLALTDFGYSSLDSGSNLYFWSYLVIEPLKCVFSIVAVRELFALTFDDYPGIRTVGRWAMYCGVALSVSISL